MRNFVIDRSKWRCGDFGQNAKGLGDTSLLNKEGYMCCLGHIARQLKWPKDKILERGCPDGVCLDSLHVNKSVLLSKDDDHGWFDSDFTRLAIEINDDNDLSQKTRERRLVRLGKKYGLNITFTGKTIPYKENS